MKTCKNCGSKLIVKQTKKNPSQFKKPYYYSAYYYCLYCKRLYHSEEFKVINPQTMPLHLGSLGSHPGSYDVEIWTDGACVYNGTERAKAAWAFVADKTERSGLVAGKQTNNVAEGLAIYNALLWAAKRGYKKIKIHSDSQISLNNLKKAPEKVKQNSEIFHNIAKVIDENSLRVMYEKVLGHSGEPNNERADKLANELATQA